MDTLIATAFALLFGACWWIELRFASKVRNTYEDILLKLKEGHAKNLKSAHSAGWLEGVEYQRNLMTRKRDKAGRFA